MDPGGVELSQTRGGPSRCLRFGSDGGQRWHSAFGRSPSVGFPAARWPAVRSGPSSRAGISSHPGSTSTRPTYGILRRRTSRLSATRCASRTCMSSGISSAGTRTRSPPAVSIDGIGRRRGTKPNPRFPNYQLPVSILRPGSQFRRHTIHPTPSMKKLLVFSLIAIFGSAQARAGDSHTPRSDLVVRVETCEAILREFMATPETSVPPAVWRKARGVMVLSQFKAGLILGVQDGYGVLMVKRPNGRWSIPVLIDASEASLGLQAGAKSVET